MLEVILDTETTGLSTTEKHRIVEIGCVELDNQIPTARWKLILYEDKNNYTSKIEIY